MNLRFAVLSIALPLISLVACGGAVDVGFVATGDAAPRRDAADAADAGPIDPVSGMPCSSLRGTALLRPREVAGWPACAFSFRFATGDPGVSGGNFDVCYDRGGIQSVLVVGDPGGWLVDLGDVPLTSVPKTVDPSGYPPDPWGGHDLVTATPGHTYFQRLVRAAGKLVASFRVESVDGSGAKIRWVRSPDPDVMIYPSACGS
jgi:hypothetical protein